MKRITDGPGAKQPEHTGTYRQPLLPVDARFSLVGKEDHPVVRIVEAVQKFEQSIKRAARGGHIPLLRLLHRAEKQSPKIGNPSQGCRGTLRAIPFSANISETICPSTTPVGRKESHSDEHEQDKKFFRCVGGFGP
jgi:hypothetical protein